MAYGKTMESSFYRPLNQPEASENIEEYVESHKSAPAGNDTGDAPAAPDVESYFTFPVDDPVSDDTSDNAA